MSSDVQIHTERLALVTAPIAPRDGSLVGNKGLLALDNDPIPPVGALAGDGD